MCLYYSVKLLLANMGMIAHPSDSAQPFQCGTIVLLSFSDSRPFCSASQLSNLQLWDLKNILHQAQKRKWLKMRHFPHSRWLFLSVYAGNFSVPCTAEIPKFLLGVCRRFHNAPMLRLSRLYEKQLRWKNSALSPVDKLSLTVKLGHINCRHF